MYRTEFWTLWEKARVGCSERTALKQVYYQGWNRSPAQVGCMRQVLGPGALGRPRGIRWRGRWEGGSGWGTHVNPWLILVNVWKKPVQYCKVISLQLIKINGKKIFVIKATKYTVVYYGSINWLTKLDQRRCICIYVHMYICEWTESHSIMSNSLRPCGLYNPWDSLGQNTGVGSLSLLQQFFLTQGLNSGFLHCRRILYPLSYQGSIHVYIQ